MDAKGITRALRKELEAAGLALSHAQTLELMARTADAKDWNTRCARLPAPSSFSSSLTLSPASSGPSVEPVYSVIAHKSQGSEWPAAAPAGFCPSCGARGTGTEVSTVFVEQGPLQGDGYAFEGDAAHCQCSACGHQWVDWQSDYPAILNVDGYVVLAESGVRHSVALYEASDVLSFLDQGVLDGTALADAVNESYEDGGHGDLMGQLRWAGTEPTARATGATLNDAVKALLSKLAPEVDAAVLNRNIGIA